MQGKVVSRMEEDYVSVLFSGPSSSHSFLAPFRLPKFSGPVVPSTKLPLANSRMAATVDLHLFHHEPAPIVADRWRNGD